MGGGGGGNARAQDEGALWVQSLVLQAALQDSVIIVLGIQTTWGQGRRERERETFIETEGKKKSKCEKRERQTDYSVSEAAKQEVFCVVRLVVISDGGIQVLNWRPDGRADTRPTCPSAPYFGGALKLPLTPPGGD